MEVIINPEPHWRHIRGGRDYPWEAHLINGPVGQGVFAIKCELDLNVLYHDDTCRQCDKARKVREAVIVRRWTPSEWLAEFGQPKINTDQYGIGLKWQSHYCYFQMTQHEELKAEGQKIYRRKYFLFSNQDAKLLMELGLDYKEYESRKDSGWVEQYEGFPSLLLYQLYDPNLYVWGPTGIYFKNKYQEYLNKLEVWAEIRRLTEYLKKAACLNGGSVNIESNIEEPRITQAGAPNIPARIFRLANGRISEKLSEIDCTSSMSRISLDKIGFPEGVEVKPIEGTPFYSKDKKRFQKMVKEILPFRGSARRRISRQLTLSMIDRVVANGMERRRKNNLSIIQNYVQQLNEWIKKYKQM